MIYRLFYLYFQIILLSAMSVIAKPPEGFSSGFGISPTILKAKILPGEQSRVVFKLSNDDSLNTQRFSIEMYDFEQTEGGVIKSIQKGLTARSISEWTDYPSEIEVPPHSIETIEITVNCPYGARGAYYGIFQVQRILPEIQQKMAVRVNPSLGVTLEITIPLSATIHLEPKELVYNFSSNNPQPSISMKIENTGDWKQPIEGDILVYDQPGQFPARASIPKNNDGTPYKIYPSMTMSLTCPLSKQLRPGNHRVSVRLRLTERADAQKIFTITVPEKSTDRQIIASETGNKFEYDIDFSVEPDIFETVIPAGGFRSLPIRVHNNDERQIKVRADITRAVMEPNGMFTFVDEIKDNSLNWLSLSTKNIEIEPKRVKSFQVQASVPRDTTIKFPLMGIVRFQVEAPSTEFHDDWSSGGEFASLIVVIDPKTPPANLEFIDFDIVRPSPEKNPTAAIVRLKNNGGKIAKVRGKLGLTRKSGEEILSRDIGDIQYELILPGSEREFILPLGPLDAGEFRVRAEFATLGKDAVKVSSEETFTSTTEIPEGLR